MVKLSYLQDTDAITILTLRMLFSMPFYIVVLILNRKKLEDSASSLVRRDWVNLIIMGIVGYYLASIFDFVGLQYVTAGLERLILFIYPTIVVILSAVFLKKKIGKIEYISLALTYLGVFVVFFDDAVTAQQNVWLGSVCIFGSALTYAFYLVGTGQLTPKLGSVNYTALSMLVSTIVVFLHFSLVKNVNVLFAKPEVVELGIYMAVFSTVIPSFLISEGIRLMGSGRASIVASVGPISTIILAYFFLGESFGMIQLFGTILVLAGVLTVSVKK